MTDGRFDFLEISRRECGLSRSGVFALEKKSEGGIGDILGGLVGSKQGQDMLGGLLGGLLGGK